MTPRETFDYYLKNWSDIQAHLWTLRLAARGHCMEIGVRSGVSTAALLTGLEDHGGDLISIDVADHTAPFQHHPQWDFYRMNSVTDADEIKRLLPDRLDLLFVDGDHEFTSVLADLRNYGTRAKRILLHDTEALDFPGVLHAVREFAQETGRGVLFYSGSYGLADIR